ncbi:S-adenosyl-L-methionine-dependent methyltransferase [Aspergillus heteromorphus CBS 117.55]|uniref:S-adenosyl-L-methionine-dependent methyltransferase n=1 Tax=Aspergillus heteromorphus CBS 117.55 TaxID=1448321 RepID=A0A317WQK5_9EURO|nr:S-adenosyl-L-methionine-dependent methyltransferase [Aspergillus heteromorphus CBS 117.55]PWY87407.1 S-adenosyl-L-methionine-dependent methyltransferase [Aspergillus heteromorphus CBS 117.55]
MSTLPVSYPADGTPALYPNERVAKRVGDYAESHSLRMPQHIIDYHAHIQTTRPETANYMISIAQAQALTFLVKTIGAKRILEIGSYVGLSLMTWSSAVGPDGKVTGLEFDPSFAAAAKDALAANDVHNAELIVGDALETLPTLTPSEPYDIIFIDAQKSGYSRYLSTILALSQPGTPNRLLRPGGLIIGDNTLRCGLVADDSSDNPWRHYDFGPQRPEYWKSADVMTLKAYNQAVVANDRLENWLCPLWDGINLARMVD